MPMPDGILLEQEYALVPVDDLRPHPENANLGDLPSITESVETNGFYGAVIAQRSTGYILIGNHRWQVAREKGATVVPTIWLDVDDAEALRIMLSDNGTRDRAKTDQAKLAALLEVIAERHGSVAGTGYDAAMAAEIMAAANVPAALTDPDDAPPLEAGYTITSPGDVWLLGGHRLVCGDATDLEAVRAALADRPAAMLWTDPPYGVAYEGKTKDKLKIANDALAADELEQLLVGSLGCAAEVLLPGGAFYVCGPSGTLETNFRSALDAVGLELRQQLVWVKDRFVLGRSDYHLQHESILYGWQLAGEPLLPPHYDPAHETMLYGWKSGAAHTYEGGRKQTSVWEHPRPSASKIHPTMKPVELVRRAVENSSRPGGLVLDLFAGSGSTLIACVGAGRVAALVELDPHYCDVICRRFEQHTGIVPILERTGDPVTFLLEAS